MPPINLKNYINAISSFGQSSVSPQSGGIGSINQYLPNYQPASSEISYAPDSFFGSAKPTTSDAINPLELGWNMPTAQLGLKGIDTLGSLWSAFQTQSMAKKQFGFQKDMANANLNNQIASYNTALESKARDSAHMQGLPQSGSGNYVDEYLKRHALRRDGQINNGAPKQM